MTLEDYVIRRQIEAAEAQKRALAVTANYISEEEQALIDAIAEAVHNEDIGWAETLRQIRQLVLQEEFRFAQASEWNIYAEELRDRLNYLGTTPQ